MCQNNTTWNSGFILRDPDGHFMFSQLRFYTLLHMKIMHVSVIMSHVSIILYRIKQIYGQRILNKLLYKTCGVTNCLIYSQNFTLLPVYKNKCIKKPLFENIKSSAYDLTMWCSPRGDLEYSFQPTKSDGPQICLIVSTLNKLNIRAVRIKSP